MNHYDIGVKNQMPWYLLSVYRYLQYLAVYKLRNPQCVCAAAQPLINERLSFTSEFSILNGVPSFILKADKGSNAVACCRFSSDGSLLVSGYEDGYVRIWDADNGKLVREQLLHESSVCDVEFEVKEYEICCSGIDYYTNWRQMGLVFFYMSCPIAIKVCGAIGVYSMRFLGVDDAQV